MRIIRSWKYLISTYCLPFIRMRTEFIRDISKLFRKIGTQFQQIGPSSRWQPFRRINLRRLLQTDTPFDEKFQLLLAHVVYTLFQLCANLEREQ